MTTSKTATLTFRINSGMGDALQVAAHLDYGLIANIIEVLIRGSRKYKGNGFLNLRNFQSNKGEQPV